MNLRKKKKQQHLPNAITTTQWTDYFRTLHQMKEMTYHAHHFKPSLGVYDETLDDDISLDEVYAVLRHMKSGKAPGKDSLKIEMYKSLPPQFIQLLVNFWKSGDKLDVNNYRGITLLPVIAKLFFAVLARRLYEWAELHEIIPVEQFGFRSGHRTIDIECLDRVHHH